jgi:hypothetical protein
VFRDGSGTQAAHVRYTDVEAVACGDVDDVVACGGDGDEEQLGKLSERAFLQRHAICDGNGGIAERSTTRLASVSG